MRAPARRNTLPTPPPAYCSAWRRLVVEIDFTTPPLPPGAPAFTAKHLYRRMVVTGRFSGRRHNHTSYSFTVV